MSPLTQAQRPSLLLYPASPGAGEEGCLERDFLWSATAADSTWRTLPPQQIVAGDSIVQYRACTVGIVEDPTGLLKFAFVQALIPLRSDLNNSRRPNLFQEARQWTGSPNINAAYLAS
jgi:hypothetical protein